jgi:hypothetical protein
LLEAWTLYNAQLPPAMVKAFKEKYPEKYQKLIEKPKGKD